MADDKRPGDDEFEEIKPANSGSYTPPEDQYGDQDEGAPAVATPPAKNLVMLLAFFAVIAVVGYIFFGRESAPERGPEIVVNRPAPPPINSAPPISVPEPLPDIPDVPPPPEPEIISSPLDEEEITFDPNADPAVKKRIQSSLLVTENGVLGDTSLGGGAPTGFEAQSNNPFDNVYSAANDNDPNTGFADSFFNQSGVPHAFARKLTNTSRLITQGKIIEAILETPINTDIPGMIRAIVSRDIYAESGRTILVPKGSRLVGTYNNFVIRGNKRVNVIWSRVIRPDGVDVMIRSPGADQLGRAGIEGEVDNKYAEIFAGAFLVSAINIAVGIAVDSLEEDKISETTNTDGSTTRNSTASQEAGIKAVDLFGNAAENLIQDFINQKPTITIDQGTRVNVFVNRDLLFPEELIGSIKVIQ